MFIEPRDVLPLRHANAPDDRARAKIEWMRDYVNRSLPAHGLGDELRVDLPDTSSPRVGPL